MRPKLTSEERKRMTEERHKREDKLHKMECFLPAWFVPRMANDPWYYALVLTNGTALLIETVDDVHRTKDNMWLDVTLHLQAETEDYPEASGFKLVGALTSRTHASVNCSHILYAVEMADH